MHPVRRLLLVLVIAGCALTAASCGSDPAIDEEFPPGNPVLGEDAGDNPVLGSEGSGLDGGRDRTDYALLSLLAVCLIGAGILLVRVERWERRRSAAAGGE